MQQNIPCPVCPSNKFAKPLKQRKKHSLLDQISGNRFIWIISIGHFNNTSYSFICGTTLRRRFWTLCCQAYFCLVDFVEGVRIFPSQNDEANRSTLPAKLPRSSVLWNLVELSDRTPPHYQKYFRASTLLPQTTEADPIRLRSGTMSQINGSKTPLASTHKDSSPAAMTERESNDRHEPEDRVRYNSATCSPHLACVY